MNKIGKILLTDIKNRIGRDIIQPLSDIADQNIQDVTTTIGSFIVRKLRGKFQRSITFTVGVRYSDNWMEEALYGILYSYNTIKKSSRLELSNNRNIADGSGMYYKLDDGTHNLKYRNYDILVCIQSNNPTTVSGRMLEPQRVYTIITYDLSPEFVTQFEADMIEHRNSILKIKSDAPTVNVYQDLHESDGYTYWEKTVAINKRRLNTIYLPMETKKSIVNTINEFFASKEYYKKHGIAHNLKILLYGPPGPQPISIEIPTPSGMKRFGDLTTGDQVFDHNGHPTTVTEIHYKGRQDVYEVKFLNGRSTKCTIDHLWKVMYRSHGEWKEDVVPLKYILDNSNLVDSVDGSQLVLSEKRWSVETNGPAEFDERPLTVDPYIMGIIISNGCLTDPYFRISQPTDEVPNVIADTMGLEVSTRSDAPDDYSYIFYDHDHVRVRTDEILKDYHELVNCKSPDRFIPEDFLFNSVENRLALLNGLLDGDGSIVERAGRKWSSPMIRFTTTSRILSEQFIWLCRSLGLDCRDHPDNRTRYTSGYCTNISIRIDPRDLHKLFRVSYKHEAALRVMWEFYDLNDEGQIPWKMYTDKSKIVSVKKLKEQDEVMCIKVASEDHLYLTENFIVTHNTGKDSIAKMIASEWNRNMYYVTGGKDGKFIPNAITDNGDSVNFPMFLVSDIDKYPFLINEPEVDIEKENGKDEQLRYKQSFGNMINALDGILSGEGRIIVMTTNHIEKFSPVILRPGRIDLQLEIGYVTPEVFRKYVWDFYHRELPVDTKLKSNKLTVASMQFDVVFLKLTADEFIKKHVK